MTLPVETELERLLERIACDRDFEASLAHLRDARFLAERCRGGGAAARRVSDDLELACAQVRGRVEEYRSEMSARVREGSLRGDELFELLHGLSAHTLDPTAPHLGDEPADIWLELVFGTDGGFDGHAAPGEEMIHYDPSPVSTTLALRRAGWFGEGRVFIDLGSGIGRVPILAALLGEGRCVGVELDAALAHTSLAVVESLAVLRVEFREGDARLVAIEDGTDFFLFTPFVGGVLDAVIDRLERLAERRPIRVASLGPSTRRLLRSPAFEANHPSASPFCLVVLESRANLVRGDFRNEG